MLIYNERKSKHCFPHEIFYIVFINFYDFSTFHGRYKTLFQLVCNMETVRCVSLVHYNICLPDIHELICQRIYTDEIASLRNENFHYNHMSFLLTPEVLFCDNFRSFCNLIILYILIILYDNSLACLFFSFTYCYQFYHWNMPEIFFKF